MNLRGPHQYGGPRVHTITKKHYIPESTFYLPKSTENTHARRGLYALWITFLCVLDNKDVYMWQEKVYDPKNVTNKWLLSSRFMSTYSVVSAL